MVLLLEDDPERIRRFHAAVSAVSSQLKIVCWCDANDMILEVERYLGAGCLISLDHDLVAAPGANDPGDGLDVAKFLVSQPLKRSVIVHSSNMDRAMCMMGEFELADWPSVQVLPFGERWIEEDWSFEVERWYRDRSEL